MIVSAQDAKRISSGRKTQLRIPRHRRAPECDRVIPITYHEPVAFSHRTEPVTLCRVKILQRWESEVFAISESEVEAEGCETRDEFLEQWGRYNFDVWVLRFELDRRDRPRLLTSRIVAGRQGAYVDNPIRALPDEPEAVDAETLEWITREARYSDRRRERQRREERAELPFDQQLRALEQEAWSRHVCIRSELRAIRRWPDPEIRQKQLEIIRQKLEPDLLVA